MRFKGLDEAGGGVEKRLHQELEGCGGRLDTAPVPAVFQRG